MFKITMRGEMYAHSCIGCGKETMIYSEWANVKHCKCGTVQRMTSRVNGSSVPVKYLAEGHHCWRMMYHASSTNMDEP